METTIIKRAWTSPVHFLPTGTKVEYIEDINDEKSLIRYDGYNYIVDKDVLEINKGEWVYAQWQIQANSNH